MIPTYIISLANQQDRREHMRQECARVGIEATFIDAVDMRQASQSDIERLSSRLLHKKPKNNAGLPKVN